MKYFLALFNIFKYYLFTLLGELENDLSDLGGGGFLPRWDGTAVGERRSGNTLSGSVHTTHGWLSLIRFLKG